MVTLTGSWNVKILFRAGSIIMLMQALIQFNLDITLLLKTSWQGKSIMDMKMHTFFFSGKKGESLNEAAFVVKKNARNSNN